jgi:hypothetical protein
MVFCLERYTHNNIVQGNQGKCKQKFSHARTDAANQEPLSVLDCYIIISLLDSEYLSFNYPPSPSLSIRTAWAFSRTSFAHSSLRFHYDHDSVRGIWWRNECMNFTWAFLPYSQFSGNYPPLSGLSFVFECRERERERARVKCIQCWNVEIH